jgi:hypothetical protein
VPGWQKLPERHPGAKALREVKLEHEMHSLYAVLKQFQPCDSSHETLWASVVQSGEKELVVLAQAVRKLDMKLQLVQTSSSAQSVHRHRESSSTSGFSQQGPSHHHRGHV